MMGRKTDDERLQEIEEKMEQMKAKKQQLASRIQSKERKERTRRLIQVGAIFEKYFDFVGEDQAEKIAYGMKDAVGKHKEKLMNIDVVQSKEKNELVYKTQDERLIMPQGNKEPYETKSPEGIPDSPEGESGQKRIGGYQLKHVKNEMS